MWVITPVERALLAAGFGPDSMNAGGLVFGMLSGVLIGLGQLEAGGWAIALSGVCDILDGRLARARKLSPRATASSSTRRSTASSRPSPSSASRSTSRRWPYGPLVVAPGSASRCS